ALGKGADRGRHAGGGRDIHAAADHRLDRFRAGLDVEDFEIEPVLLENAAALAELGDARVPGAALRARDLPALFRPPHPAPSPPPPIMLRTAARVVSIAAPVSFVPPVNRGPHMLQRGRRL